MERNLTRAALDTVLGQHTDLAPLAGKLAIYGMLRHFALCGNCVGGG